MILHITNDYSGSTVYKNLVRELDELGLPQIVYNPIRERDRIGKNGIELKINESQIIYSHILNKSTDRILYWRKIKKIVRDIEKKVDFSKIKLIHAHTWYSDGGVAHELFKKYKIPYIVTIRNTDINLFQSKLIYLRTYGRKILENTERVILISGAYKDRVLSQSSLKRILPELENKIEIIPNGVDTFWIDKAKKKVLNKRNKKELLYIGNFNSGKNVLNLLEAIKAIDNERGNCRLSLVGGGGTNEKMVLKQIKQFPEIFTYHGKVYDKVYLEEIFQSSCIFTMPSRNETFGLVYVEAMLQGLPILYTKDEGIDGFYKELIGEKVNKKASVLEIKNSILKLIDSYNDYEIPTDKLIKNHDWRIIAKSYENIYKHSAFVFK